MKKLALNNNTVAFVDNKVYSFIQKNKLIFFRHKIGNNDYAVCDLRRSKDKNKPHIYLYLHRLVFAIMTSIIPNKIDHKNRDGLDCQFSNLRETTRSLNSHNQRIYSKTGYQGLWFDKNNDRYYVTIMKDGKKHKPGSSKNIKRAAEIYNEAVVKIYGKYARLNEIKN
jgi:hypothetical protein